MTNPDIIIYTDGSSRGNPGPGGYGIVMQEVDTSYKKEFSMGFKKTTNNRMELLAVIIALEKLKKPNQKVHIYTDSKYVSDSVEKKWVFNWESKGFKNKKNPDLWIRFLTVYKKHNIESLLFNSIELNNNTVLENLTKTSPDLIVLAGFLQKIPEKIINAFKNKIINIHPSLLPKYGGKGMYGLNVHRSVIKNNDSESGFTVHYVNKDYDEGDIIFQKTIKVATDDPNILAKKVLIEEHKYYPEIIKKVLYD